MSYSEKWLKKATNKKLLEAICEEGSNGCERGCQGRCISCPADDIRQITEELNKRIEELENRLECETYDAQCYRDCCG